MKKFLILGLFAASVALGLSACSEDETCYTCTNSTVPGCELDICDSEITTSGTCGSGSFTADGDNEQIKTAYENDGWTCRAQ